MGISDAIPGVSGGTVALILGIYPRLINALGGIGPKFLRALANAEFWATVRGRLNEGPRPLDADGDNDADRVLFLAFLGVGVVSALILGAGLIPTLLDRYPAQMRGLFLGLVLASVAIPFRMMKNRHKGHVVVALVATVVTLWFVSLSTTGGGKASGEIQLLLPPGTSATSITPENTVLSLDRGDDGPPIVFGPSEALVTRDGGGAVTLPVIARMAGELGNLPAGGMWVFEGPIEHVDVAQREAFSGGVNPSYVRLFLSGMVAISAMILPGISGSFVLLLFGLYHYVTFSLRQALFNQDPDAVLVVLTVVTAILAGLLTFSRVMRWLFQRAPDHTLAALVGLMLGSLAKLWPFVAYEGTRERLALPNAFDGVTISVLIAFFFGVALVTGMERAGTKASGHESKTV